MLLKEMLTFAQFLMQFALRVGTQWLSKFLQDRLSHTLSWLRQGAREENLKCVLNEWQLNALVGMARCVSNTPVLRVSLNRRVWSRAKRRTSRWLKFDWSRRNPRLEERAETLTPVLVIKGRRQHAAGLAGLRKEFSNKALLTRSFQGLSCALPCGLFRLFVFVCLFVSLSSSRD